LSVNYLSAESLSKSFHEKWLFKDVTFGIAKGEKLALVGANGAGKSTLLRILTGEIQSDGGRLSSRNGIRMGYLTQTPSVADNIVVNDLLFDDKNPLAVVVRDYEDAIHDLHTSSERMQELLEQMEHLNAWGFDAKVQEITSKLGVPDLHKTFGQLSGGQRKRIFLAQLLLAEPDLIILDEPTNHLDLEAILWLENYLRGVNITLIMVTHDRYFLDNVATKILELDRQKLFTYVGNYAYFLEKKSDREEMLKTEVEKARNLMKSELEWMRKQPRARGTKAKYRIDAFEELKEKASQDLRKDRLELEVKSARQGGKILEVEKISKSYDGNPVISDFSYVFKKKDRIGVVGKNGVGKSTFLGILTGRQKPDTGEVVPGLTTKIGYFTQEVADLNPSHRVIDEVKNIAEFITLADGSTMSASRFLETFLFPPEKQYTFIEKISGGEKKRLQLLKILITNPNFLVLDEPTNDFDIDTLNVLEDFLLKFQGCLLLVSHDRYFMDHLVEQLFVFEGEGEIRLFNGNYSDYRVEQDNEPEDEPQPVAVVQEKVVNTPTKKKVSFSDKKEFETIEADIARLELEKQQATEKLSTGGISVQDITALSTRIATLTRDIDEKTNRWLQLEELIKG
jgi:ATP-binding cassette subfamily F protein uup